MSVIIRLQNLPWSANALDIRNFFRGLSIPEGGVHIVGGELGDAFIAFSTDEDARQAMMLDGGKIKEIQVKLLLSSRSEMHKVIETARQNVPLLSLATAAPTVSAVAPINVPQNNLAASSLTVQSSSILPTVTPFSAALGTNSLTNFGIPGLGNPQEIPQPAVIEPPPPLISPSNNKDDQFDDEREEEKTDRKRSREKDKRRSRSRSRSRDRKERKRDRRDRSRSRERRRRDRSRSRERRGRKRDRKDRSRSRDRSSSRRSRDRRNDRRSPGNAQEKMSDYTPSGDSTMPPILPGLKNNINAPVTQGTTQTVQNGPLSSGNESIQTHRFTDPDIMDAYNKLQELGKKRNPNAFQGDQANGGGKMSAGRGGSTRGGYRRDGRVSRFDNEPQRGCCLVVRNAPNHTSYGDVRRFFPFMIDKHGIKMINDNTGRRTGTIYVRFCDARSKLLALQRKNNELKGVEVIVEDLDDETYETAVDSFLPYRDDNDDEEQSLATTETAGDVSQPPFNVLKLSDLPNFVKEHDIMKVFGDFSLTSIIINDCRVSRTKIAYVQFAKNEDARLALERKEKCIFGRRQATCVSVSTEEFEKVKSQNEKMSNVQVNTENNAEETAPAPRDPRQRRADLPPAVQPAPFFAPPFVPPQSFPPVAFGSPQFSGFPGGSVDPRTAAKNWAQRPQFQPRAETSIPAPKVAISTEMDDAPLDCVLMKGLPRGATDRTIVTFLADTGAVPARIHLMLDTNGLPSGDCFCEFRSAQEARMAAAKHGKDLEGCRITVDLVPRSVVEEALEGPKQPEPSLLGNGPPPPFFAQMRGGFPPRGPFRGTRGFERGGFDRGGFGHRGGFDQSMNSFDQSRGGFRGRGGFQERGRGFDRGRGRGFGRGGSGGFENGREDDQDPALQDFGAPGCVVSMENVPFRATIDEILQFFSEFELSHDDVIRRYNERGQPTGDARVAFRTPFDATRAVKTHHLDTIHERRITLNIL